MFTLQILGLGELRSSIFSLLAVSNSATLRCSPSSVSLAVSYSHEFHSFVVSFQMFDPFFTIFSGGDGDYNFDIDLQELSRLILADDDLFLTILLPSAFSSANLISSTRDGKFRSLASLCAMLPQNREVSKFDLKLFVAIDAVKFREIVARLSDYNGPIFATASTSQVKFYGRTAEGEIIGATLLTAERRECLAGGFDDRDYEIKFSFALKPKDFFGRSMELTKLVWFFESTRWNTTVICFTREWTNILASYPRDICITPFLNSFSLHKILRYQKRVQNLDRYVFI